MKRPIIIFCLIVYCSTILAYDFKASGLFYNITSDAEPYTVEVTYDDEDGESYTGDITIPSKVKKDGITYQVTSIGVEAFYASAITSVAIPKTVTRIGDDAFYYTDNLTSVTFNEGLVSIGANAFASATALTSIDIPSTVTTIGQGAFDGCSQLASVTFHDGLVTIGANAFSYTAITSIDIPSTVTTIGETAFSACSQLASVTFHEGLNTISADAFSYCPSLLSAILPNSVTSIEDNAFSDCSSLVDAYIGHNVSAMGYDVFAGCTNVSIVWNVKGEHSLTPLATNYDVPSIIFGEDVTMIPDGFCEDMTSLSSVRFPANITRVPTNMCYGCSSLTSIDIPSTVTSIGQSAFDGCSQLASVPFNEGLKTIDTYAFYGCTALDSVILPSSVEYIGNASFQECTNLSYFQIDARTPPTIGGYDIFTADLLETICIPCNTEELYRASDWNDLELSFVQVGDGFHLTAEPEHPIRGRVDVLLAPSCSDSEAIIQAVPNEGYSFVAWNDGCNDNPRTIILADDTTVIALFKKQFVVTEKNHLVVTAKDGTQVAFALQEKPIVTFLDDNLRIQSQLTDVYYSLENMATFTYEKRDISSAVMDLQSDALFHMQGEDYIVFPALNENTYIALHTVTGAVLFAQTIRQAGEYGFSLSQLMPAIYILTVNDVTYKIVKR